MRSNALDAALSSIKGLGHCSAACSLPSSAVPPLCNLHRHISSHKESATGEACLSIFTLSVKTPIQAAYVETSGHAVLCILPCAFRIIEPFECCMLFCTTASTTHMHAVSSFVDIHPCSPILNHCMSIPTVPTVSLHIHLCSANLSHCMFNLASQPTHSILIYLAQNK